MADTTQTQASAPKNAEKFKVYYYSDMSMTDERYHHLPILAPLDLDQAILDGKLWHVTAMVPPKDMVDPVLDPNANGGIGAWVENDKNGQAQKLADMQTKVDSLTIANDKLVKDNTTLANQVAQVQADKNALDTTVKTMQTNQQASTTQSLAMTKALQNIAENQEEQKKAMASMQQILLAMQTGNATQPTHPTVPSQDDKAKDDTKPAEPTDNSKLTDKQ